MYEMSLLNSAVFLDIDDGTMFSKLALAPALVGLNENFCSPPPLTI